MAVSDAAAPKPGTDMVYSCPSMLQCDEQCKSFGTSMKKNERAPVSLGLDANTPLRPYQGK